MRKPSFESVSDGSSHAPSEDYKQLTWLILVKGVPAEVLFPAIASYFYPDGRWLTVREADASSTARGL